jgi:TolB-like protein
VIGSEVYDRKPPYQPSMDSIARTEARRLRKKLQVYYETVGTNDLIYVSLRLGSYIPIFLPNAACAGAQTSMGLQKAGFSTRRSGIVAIFAFTDISQSLLSSKCARSLSDELACTLVRTRGCRVVLPVSAMDSRAGEQDVAAAMGKLGAHIAFEGSVREENNHIRVIARIVDEAGFHLWATRFDGEAGAHGMFALEEQIAATLCAGYDSLFAGAARYEL